MSEFQSEILMRDKTVYFDTSSLVLDEVFGVSDPVWTVVLHFKNLWSYMGLCVVVVYVRASPLRVCLHSGAHITVCLHTT